MAKTQDNAAWAVEFGGSAVRLLRVARSGSGFRAVIRAEVPLDERWETAPDVIAAVEKMNAGKLDGPLVACVGDELVLYHSVSLPHAEPKALAKMVQGQLEVLIPAEPERFVTAWRSFDDPRKTGFLRVLICAARREALSGPIEACKRLGRGPDAVVPSMAALATAWTQFCDDEGGPVVLLDVAARCTVLGIVEKGHLLECGAIDLGGDHWTERIAGRLKLDHHNAEIRKLEYSADPSGAGDEVAAAVEEAMSDWSRQLREVYDHCAASIPRKARPDRCILFGRSGRLPTLPSRVAATLDMPVQSPETHRRLSLTDDMDFDVAATPIGAALIAMAPDSPAVSLVSAPRTKPVRSVKRKCLWAAAVVWLLAGVLTLHGLDRANANRLTRARRDLETRIDRQRLARRRAISDYLESFGPTPLSVLARTSRIVPEGTLLSNWKYDRTGQASIGGTVPNEKDFLAMLKELQQLGKVELKSCQPDKDKFRFNVLIKVGRTMAPATSKPSGKADAQKPGKSPPAGPTSKPSTVPSENGRAMAPAVSEPPGQTDAQKSEKPPTRPEIRPAGRTRRPSTGPSETGGPTTRPG